MITDIIFKIVDKFKKVIVTDKKDNVFCQEIPVNFRNYEAM